MSLLHRHCLLSIFFRASNDVNILRNAAVRLKPKREIMHANVRSWASKTPGGGGGQEPCSPHPSVEKTKKIRSYMEISGTMPIFSIIFGAQSTTLPPSPINIENENNSCTRAS